jgi:hypothetical protein
MIVRDCANPLRAALESARPFMDEMVVVDTGSVDGTRDVAAELGARVFDFPWCDDFSAARNCSLEHATGNWIFTMDSDHVLPPESGAELKRLVASCPKRDLAFWVTVEEHSVSSTGQPRLTGHAELKLFPRLPDVRYCYRVHEQVAPALQRAGVSFRASSATVRHSLADRSAAGDARRIERNLRLLQLDLADRPNDPAVLLNLGMTHLYHPDGLPQAIEYTRQSLKGLAPGSPTLLNAYLVLSEAHLRNGDISAAIQTCQKASVRFPEDATLLLRLGGLYEQRGDLALAAASYRKVLESGKLRLSVAHLRDTPARAALRLGQVYWRMGRRDRAEQVWQDYLQRDPTAASVRAALAELYLGGHSVSTS